jgi:1-deoxy-D-xylulose-5-phosphate synthase
MPQLLSTLNLPQDLKTLSFNELGQLADEVRALILNTASHTGGHLASSLGVVELTVALHAAYDSPHDKVIWDVGHQAYAHKILTGRSSRFHTLRQKGGISGFPNINESPHDQFTVGHASTSISSAVGMAKAREITGRDYHVVCVIGDGSMTGGLALEGINNLAGIKDNLVVVLNDNQMSISKNVGAFANYFTKFKTSQSYMNFRDRVERMVGRIPKIGHSMVMKAESLKNRIKHFLVDLKAGVMLEELGIRYLGPIDGHNIPLLIATLQYAKEVKGPIVVHVLTKKGKGYEHSEADPTKFHGIAPFKMDTGELETQSDRPSYTSIFGKTMTALAGKDPKIVAITAAMAEGTGLVEFSKRYPNRIFDVGIAEEHAVTFAAGLAKGGAKPVVAIYSTFLQRAYDQIMQDVCLQNLPVIFAVDRAGIVGEDGATHNGIFDIAYLRTMPNLVLMAPKDVDELSNMLISAMSYNLPVAIRYPRGQGPEVKVNDTFNNIELGRSEVVYKSQNTGPKRLVLAYGAIVTPSVEAAKLAEAKGINSIVVNARFAKPLDDKFITDMALKVDKIITVEDGIVDGGFGSAVVELLNSCDIKTQVVRLGLPDKFIEHGKRNEILDEYGLSPKKIAEAF